MGRTAELDTNENLMAACIRGFSGYIWRDWEFQPQFSAPFNNKKKIANTSSGMKISPLLLPLFPSAMHVRSKYLTWIF